MADKIVNFSSSVGSKFYTPVEYEFSEKHKCFVPKSGKKVNRYAMIQASKPACDINYIVQRAQNGDFTALNVRVGDYADVSEIPDNLNDLHNMNVNALNSFSNLDPNLRSLFDNDVDKFIAAVNDGSYVKVINDALNLNKNVEKVEGGE